MSLITAVILTLHSATAWEQPAHALRRHITAALPVDQLFQRDVLGIRQASQVCQQATDTVCPDGNGCCPYGEPCAYTTTSGTRFGICEGFCPAGAATCTTPISACCPDVGATCGADGSCTVPSGSAVLPPSSAAGIGPQSSFRGPASTPVSVSSGVFNSPSLGLGQSTALTGHLSGSSAIVGHTSASAPASSPQAGGSQSSASVPVPTGGAPAAVGMPMGWLAVVLASIVCTVQQL